MEDEQPIIRWTLDWLGGNNFKSRRITHPESTTNISNEFYKRKHDHNVDSYGDINNSLNCDRNISNSIVWCRLITQGMNYIQACKCNQITWLKHATQRIGCTRIRRYNQKIIPYEIYLDMSHPTIEYQHR